MASKSRIKKSNLNPVFHKRGKSEDCAELSKDLVKTAKKTGKLSLSNKGLSTIPDKVWHILEADEPVEVSLDTLCEKDEDELWWNQTELTNLDLSFNSLTSISPKIENLFSLTVLNLQDNLLTSVPKEIGKLEKLSKVNLSRNKLSQLPSEFFRLGELTYLNLSHNNFSSISPDVSDLHMLQVLDLSNNQITSLPGGMGFLVRLIELNCSCNEINELPADFVNMRSLQKLDMLHNNLKSLPEDIGQLRKLECLYLQHNDIEELPIFDGCDQLTELHISNNFIKKIPTDFCEKLPHLKILDLRDNKIEKLTEEIAFLQNLIRLDLSNNSINSLPNCLSTLAHLQSLQLEGNPIKSIRRDIIQCGTQRVLKVLRDRAQETSPDMAAAAALVKKPLVGDMDPLPDRYKIRKNRCLSVTMMGLSQIPEQLFHDALQENAYMVDFSRNKLTEIPKGLQMLSNCCTELILSKNYINDVPLFISQFNRLGRIDLSSNSLSKLPQAIGSINTLRELNLSNNRFTEIPECIYNLKWLEILIMKDNKIKEIDASENGLGSLNRLGRLDLSNNNIEHVPPILGKLKQITNLELIGNPFKLPRQQILVKGTEAIMSYLRDRIPA